MDKSLVRRIMEDALVEERMEPGEEVKVEVDQTLTHDSLGTLTYLEFEAMDVSNAKTDLSVSYVDHNTLQTDYRSSEDHEYLRTVAAKHGIHFSRAGNGICHQIHLERFARPGKILVGGDSHTTTAGGVGMLAIGMGGLDVASVMAGEPLSFRFPEVVGVRLVGELRDWVSAKDVILELLRRVGVEGGVGKVFEYFGPGVKTLDVPSRATITNMGAETGATTSIFPSDKKTREWLKAQQRENQWIKMTNEDVDYDEVIEIDLSEIKPMVALPHSPGNVVELNEVVGLDVDQVAIGSCTNSSFKDLKKVSKILEGNKVSEDVTLIINPGSKQVVENLIESGNYQTLIDSGAWIKDNACGPCIGMGGVPPSNSRTVRTYNRNFIERTGTPTAKTYLVSPEVAAVTALEGEFSNPKSLNEIGDVDLPKTLHSYESFIKPPKPPEEADDVEVVRGSNIQPLPDFPPLPEKLSGEVLIKLSDNITTDQIIPAGPEILPLRSNVPEISKYLFSTMDASFYDRAMMKDGGFIVAGENFGQGSSREHAAIAPKYVGIKAVLAESFYRIYRANLINFGIVPLVGATKFIDQQDALEIDLTDLNEEKITVKNRTKDVELDFDLILSERERKILKAGGLLPFVSNNHHK